jgi:hypothetical protein
MTFEKWWIENAKPINKCIAYKTGIGPRFIRESFESAWHDGFKIGFRSPNKAVTKLKGGDKQTNSGN